MTTGTYNLNTSSTDRSEAVDQLLPLVYPQLRQLAEKQMAKEADDHSLQPTALVHEVYLRLANSVSGGQWDSIGHFYSAAAESMRRVLVESARKRNSLKRGGGRRRVELTDGLFVSALPSDDLLALHESLDRLAEEDAVKAELVKLRFFAGLSHQEAAQALEISRATADRYWAYAKVWLYMDMQQDVTVVCESSGH